MPESESERLKAKARQERQVKALEAIDKSLKSIVSVLREANFMASKKVPERERFQSLTPTRLLSRTPDRCFCLCARIESRRG